MTHFHYKENILHCEDSPVQEIAEEFGTPLYLYSKQQLLDNFRSIDGAFAGIDHVTCYALKANSNHSLLKLLAEEGAGADAVSSGEIHLALKAGFDPTKITFAGVGKRDDEIEYALKKNIFSFNVESQQELDVLNAIAGRLGTKARIALRINPDIDASTHPYISTGLKTNKFGIDISYAMIAFKYASSLPNLQVDGIHTHIGSQILKLEPFMQTAQTVVNLVKELKSIGIDIHHIDFGGGFGVTYKNAIKHPLLPVEETNGAEEAPANDIFISSVLPILKTAGCKLVIEPGRSIIANTGILVTKVLYMKDNGVKKFVIVDAGMNDLLRPSLYNAYHQIVPLTVQQRESDTVDVVGPVCETGDFFARDRELPTVERGEYLAVLTAGAYGIVNASHYNARLRPAEVLVNGVKVRVIRERETFDDL
ncbi:MAG: diaminopimelate decarboxylase [Ignavibacteriales bacterium]|nr:diaminopimelate decarboxylase [Ignavibacteriales bacterium]